MKIFYQFISAANGSRSPIMESESIKVVTDIIRDSLKDVEQSVKDELLKDYFLFIATANEATDPPQIEFVSTPIYTIGTLLAHISSEL